MALNVGYIALGCMGVEVRVYYDMAWLNDDPTRDAALAPLIDGPRGYCLDITNTTGRKASFTLTSPDGTVTTVDVQRGDPVITGPTAGRSRTAAQMAQLGITTRGSVAGFELQCA